MLSYLLNFMFVQQALSFVFYSSTLVVYVFVQILKTLLQIDVLVDVRFVMIIILSVCLSLSC